MLEKVVIMRMKELYEGLAKVEVVPKSRCDVQECGVCCSGEVLMFVGSTTGGVWGMGVRGVVCEIWQCGVYAGGGVSGRW